MAKSKLKRGVDVSLKDTVQILRTDQKELTQNVNQLTLDMAVYVERMDGIITGLKDYNEQQNGHIRDTALSLKRLNWQVLSLLAVIVLMASGVITDLRSLFVWLIRLAGIGV